MKKTQSNLFETDLELIRENVRTLQSAKTGVSELINVDSKIYENQDKDISQIVEMFSDCDVDGLQDALTSVEPFVSENVDVISKKK